MAPTELVDNSQRLPRGGHHNKIIRETQCLISNAWSTGLVCLVLTLAGCGGGGGNAPANNTPAATQNDPTPAVAQSVNGAYRGKLYYLMRGSTSPWIWPRASHARF